MLKILSALFFLLVSFGFAENIIQETPHFIFKGDSKDVTQEIMNFCEEQYFEITQNLKEPENKITIDIYSDILTFHKAINREDASDYLITYRNSDLAFSVVSPSNPGTIHSSLSILTSISANIEKTILFCNYDLPLWLIEAIRYQKRYERLKNHGYFLKVSAALQKILKEENFKIANVSKLTNTLFSNFENEYKEDKEKAIKNASEIITLITSLVQYIIDNWSYNHLLQINKNNNFSDVFGMSLEEFEKNWFEYTKILN